MKVVQERIVLQYPAAGTRTSNSRYTDGSYPVVHENEAGMFVALDSASGGYPYPVSIDGAHNFRTVEKADEYQRSFKYFIVRKLIVTYEVQ